jgi:periplasmic divalent cation tolerance protein
MTHPLVALCTCPDTDVAQKIASALVTEELAACVNILPNIRSVYRWDGALCNDEEVLLIIKTTSDRLEDLQQRVKALHPYDCPECIAMEITDGLPDYLNWVIAQTRPMSGGSDS